MTAENRDAATGRESLFAGTFYDSPALVCDSAGGGDRMDDEASRREHWRTPRTVVRVWTCGDDYCDCEQAQVLHIEPNIEVGYPWIRPTQIDEGPFYTDGEGWIDGKVHADAEALAKKHGLEYDRG